MSFHYRLPLLAIALAGAAALSACDPRATSPDDTASPGAEVIRGAASLTIPGPLTPPPTFSGPHPWVGKTLSISRRLNGTGRCFIPDSLKSGSAVKLGLCYSAPLDSAQHFVVAGGASFLDADKSPVILRAQAKPSLCLDVRGGTASGGEVLQLFTCNGAPSERFRLPIPAVAGNISDRGPITTGASGYRMAIEVDQPLAGFWRPLLQRAFFAGRDTQQWDFYAGF